MFLELDEKMVIGIFTQQSTTTPELFLVCKALTSGALDCQYCVKLLTEAINFAVEKVRRKKFVNEIMRKKPFAYGRNKLNPSSDTGASSCQNMS